MAIEFSCTGCDRLLRVDDTQTGKTARCPDCGSLSTIPSGVSIVTPFADAPLANEHTRAPAVETENPYKAPQSFAPDISVSKLGDSPFVNVRLASRLKRFAGRLIDNVLTMLGMIPAFVYLIWNEFEAGPLRFDDTVFFMMAIGGAIFINIFQWYLITTSGQSVGKKLLGIRIVCMQTKELAGFARTVMAREWLNAIITQFCRVFSLVDALAIFGQEQRCIHDYFANTIVIDA